MKIAVIGAGNVGGALAQQFIKAGHEVCVGAKFPLSEKSQRLAQLIGESHFTEVANAVQKSEVVIITTPPDAAVSILHLFGAVNDKVIIDATNAVRVKPEPYATVFDAIKTITGAEHVVKCFNSTGFENMLNPIYSESGIDMFAAGNSLHAKKVAEQLAKSIGFATCYDFGGDDKVALLEQFALSWINLAIMQGHGRDLAFKIIKR